MASASMVHAIGVLSTLAMLMILSYVSMNYVASMTQAIVVSQLEETAARVSSTIVDLTVLAVNSKSESFAMEKKIDMPITVSDKTYSILLVRSDGMWKVRARLNDQPTVWGEAALWSEDSPIIQMVEGVIPAGKPLIVRCEKQTVGGNMSVTVQLRLGG